MQKHTEQVNRLGQVVTQEQVSGRVSRLAALVACASVLQVAETLLPYPLAGVRLGLANVFTLVALVETGPADAFRLALLRSLMSSFVLGTFLSPAFVLSFAGAVVSAAVMVLLFRMTAAGSRLRFSFIGISVAGSVAHVLAQLVVVYVLFVRASALVALWPVLTVSGVVMGILTGIVAIHVSRRLEERRDMVEAIHSQVIKCPDTRAVEPAGTETQSFIHRLRAEAKIAVVISLALIVVLVRSWWLYAGVLLLIAAVTVVGRVGLRPLFRHLRRLAVFVAVAFLAPAFFTVGGRVLFALGPVQVTASGIESGAVLAARIILLFLVTTLLSVTTKPELVASGLERILSPLQYLGVATPRLAQALNASWSLFPVLWHRAQEMVRTRNLKKGWSAVAEFLPELVASLYAEAEQAASVWPDSDKTPGVSKC